MYIIQLKIKIIYRIRQRCGQGCSSGGTGSQDDGGFGNDGVYAMTTYNIHLGICNHYTLFVLLHKIKIKFLI